MVARPWVQRVVSEPGEPWAEGIRGKFERRLGADLGGVRVHAYGAPAIESTNALDALAYTVGSDIVFAQGSLDHKNPKEHRLLAHEITHVVQQTSPTKRVAATPRSEPDTPALSPVARSIQRTACQDAARLHAVRAGRPVPAATEPTAESRAAEDASWAAAASAIDFAATVLESPVGRGILSMLPGPAGMVGGSSTPSSLRLVSAVLPEIRSVWDLLSNPALLMARVRTFVDSHMEGVPEFARARLAGATFETLRDSRHMVAIGLAVGDSVAELLTNWTTPFVTAWNTFISPFDVDAEMADLACIQERYAAGEIDTFEAYSAVYGWIVGWVNRYSVYVTIALVGGGGLIGATGGTVGGGAVGAAAGGAPAAPGAAAGGGGGFFAGAGAGWAIAEEIGLGVLALNAAHMLLEVSAAVARLEENDRLVEADAAAGRTPSAEERERRTRQEQAAYSGIAQVIVGLGIMGSLVLLGTFGPQLARVAVASLSRRYPSLARFLASAGERFERSSVRQALREFDEGSAGMRERLGGRPTRREPEPRRDAQPDPARTGEPDPDPPSRAEPDPEPPRAAEPDLDPPRTVDPDPPRAVEPDPGPPRALEPDPDPPRTAEPEAPRAAELDSPSAAEPEASPVTALAAPPVRRTLRSDLATRIDQAIELAPASSPFRGRLLALRDALRRAARELTNRSRTRSVTPDSVSAIEGEFVRRMEDLASDFEVEGDRAVADALRGGESPSSSSADVAGVLDDVSEGTGRGRAIDPRDPAGTAGDPALPEGTTDPGSRAIGRRARGALRRRAGPAPEGWQNHHIVPLELREHPAVYDYDRVVMGVDNPRDIRSIGDRFVDSEANNLPMPSTAETAGSSGVTVHRGSHPEYTAYVEGRLDALWAERANLNDAEFARRFDAVVGDAEVVLGSGAWGPQMRPPRAPDP